MSNQKQIFIAILRSLQKEQPLVRTLFEEILFGKSSIYTLQLGKITPITIYFYETIPQLLVVVNPQNQQRFFDLRNSAAQLQSLKHEMIDKSISKLPYLLLTNPQEELLLIFAHSEEKTTFQNLLKFYKRQMKKYPQQINTVFLSTFTLIDTNRSMTVSKDEIEKLLLLFKLKPNEQMNRIEQFVRQQQNIGDGQISFRQFEKMMRLMQCRQELKNLFERYTHTKLKSLRNYTTPFMNKMQFKQFLKLQQHQKIHIDKIVWQVFQKEDMLSFHHFSQFIFDKENSAYQPHMEDECIDQELPLTSYACFSSHNTYLTGNQLTSQSRAQRYLQDLQNGYRCVQIDIHNGNKEPIVKHGYTMTSQITFQDVIKCISEFSINNPSHTPIILSLENHTGAEQQRMMAKILKKYFATKLLIIEEAREESNGKYPTLQSCLGKIIIKNSGSYDQYKTMSNNDKLQTELLMIPRSTTLISEEQIASEEMDEQINYGIQKIIDYSQSHLQKIQEFTRKRQELQKLKAAFFETKTYFSNASRTNFSFAPKKHKIVLELLSLTAMLGNGSLQKPQIWESISLSEGKILKILNSKPQAMKKHTKQHWIRSYPSGARVDSSNYNPLPALELGVQIIAINSQNADHFSVTMREYFRYGSKYCRGYRPKQTKNASKPLSIELRPISGFRIKQIQQSNSIPQISVNMSFLGTQQDMERNQKYVQMMPFTEIIKNNAYNPVFENPQTMKLEIKDIQKAFLLIQVADCGVAVVALQGLRKGYRIVNLLDDTFWANGSAILFKFE